MRKKQLTNSRYFLLLVVIITIMGAVLRFVKLDQLPPILNRDEAALAYNAFTLLKTGQDEWGRAWPVQFQSFGDYKLGGYIYLLWGLFQFLPATDWVVRLPAMFAGTLLIPLTAAFVHNLTQRRRISLFAALFIALSPFAFFYSRMAWEAMVGLMWLMASLVILTRPHKKNTLLSWSIDVVGVDLFLLACLTYNAPLLLTPILLPLIFLLNKQHSMTRAVGVSLLILAAGIFVGWQLWEVSSQKSGITLFQHPTILSEYPAYRQAFPTALQTVFGNQYVYYLWQITKRWLATFSPQFLVFKGGTHPWHSILGTGHLYLSVYSLAIIGVIKNVREVYRWLTQMIKKKRPDWPTLSLVLLFLLAASPLPAVITFDAPHATRSLFTLVMICVMAAVGWESLLQWHFIHRSKKAVIRTILLVLLFESVVYFQRYFIVWPAQGFTTDFNLSLPQAVEQTAKSERVNVVDESGYIYIVIAWYEKTEPSEFLATVERTEPSTAGLYAVKKFSRFAFVHPSTVPELSGKLIQWNGREWEVLDK